MTDLASSSSAAPAMAIFTVCADTNLSNAALSAAMYVPGAEFAGDFQSYITRTRRPSFPSNVKQARSCIALIDFDQDWNQAVETAQILSATTEQKIVPIGVGSEISTDILLQAMRAGCSEFLQKPIDSAAFQQTLQQWQARLTAQSPSSSQRGKVVSLFGVKGGVGTTAIAVHLAAELAKNHGKRVLLIDHHLRLGHVCLYLGLKESQYDFAEVVRNLDRLDADLLNGFVLKHSSGAHVIASSDNYTHRVPDPISHTTHVLDMFRSHYDLILLDSTLATDENASALIDSSDEVLIVSTPDLAGVRDLSRVAEAFQSLPKFNEKLRVVVNRRFSGDGIDAEQIAKAAGVDVTVIIPNQHPHLMNALNTGTPLMWPKGGEFAKAIKVLANHIFPADAPSSTRKKFLGLFQ